MFIQAGVFADHENARRRVEVLLAAGIELASLDELPGTRTLHRVRVGPVRQRRGIRPQHEAAARARHQRRATAHATERITVLRA